MKTADPELMRAINRCHVIDAIRRRGPIARVDIAERTKLSRATVSAITGGLIEEGLVGVVRVEQVGNGTRGRPRVMLELNGGAFHVAGVKLSADRIGIVATDARGEPKGSLMLPMRIAGQLPDAVADLVEDGVRRCVAGAGLPLESIRGVGIGLPGIIDAVSGVSHWSPLLGSMPVPFGQDMARRLGLPVLIENDASLVALAEHWFAFGRGLSSFAVVTVEDAIGLGLVIEGRIHRGAHGIGPELGHVKLDPQGPLCRCGQRGCLDAYASDWGIVRAATAAGAIGPGQEGETRRQAEELVLRAEAGDAVPAAIVRRAGEALGIAIANLVNLLNPPRLVISGEGLRAGDLLRQPMLATLEANVLPTLREATEIVFHPWGDEMWARGAATIVLRQIYEAPWDNTA